LSPGAAIRLGAGAIVASRLATALRTRAPVVVGDDVATGGPADISVIIPARNEAERIGPLLGALAGASRVVEIIVVDDESSDDTVEVVRRAGADVMSVTRPPDWAGKTWALQQGLEHAAGDWVVAFDADTRPDPRLPAALVDRCSADGIDLLTVAARFEMPTGATEVLHPAMLTTLVYRFGVPGSSVPLPHGRRLANGQCLVARRTWLLEQGGLESVAGSTVEDVALARHFASRGWKVGFLDASELLATRMYESAGATWSGWGRSLALPGVEPRYRQLLDLFVLFVTLPLPLLRLVSGRADRLDGALLAARLGVLVGTRRVYRAAGPLYWLSPLADIAAFAALAASVFRRTQTWKGRRYEL